MKTASNKLRFTAAAMSAMMALGGLSPCVSALSADDASLSAFGAPAGFPESSALFEGFVNSRFGISAEKGAKLPNASGRKALGEYDQVVYDILSERIAQVADGTLTSSRFEISRDELRARYGSSVSINSFDLQTVMTVLLLDHPYELYWYDKTVNIRVLSGFTGLTFEFPVSADYSADGTVGTTNTNAEKIASVSKAVSTARGILNSVDKNWSDYRVMTYFKDRICELVSYNYDAADNSDTIHYGDPWQLVYVFDNDPSTNVVCEGYSKAFKYLCDSYNFNSDVTCDLISGVMSTTTPTGYSTGGHMWNKVTIGDTCYLVDVTNTDDGSIGENGKLFFAGAQESDRFTNSQGELVAVNVKVGGSTVNYQYDSDTLNSYTADELSIAYNEPKLHNVYWVDTDSTVLETDELVADGEHPVYNGAEPTSSEGTFAGWTPDYSDAYTVSSSDGDITFTASYDSSVKTEYCTVTFNLPDGCGLFSELTVPKGESAAAPGDPAISNCTFEGWYYDTEFTQPFDVTATVASDTDIYAHFVCEISWNMDDGTPIVVDEVDYGELPEYAHDTPVKTASQQHEFEFSGWLEEITPAYESTSYTASFKSKVRTYTVTWKNGAQVLEVDYDVPYGEIPQYDGAEPQMEGDGHSIPKFAGWTPEVGPITGDTEYSARFTSTLISYKVEWLDEDGTVLDTSMVNYGKTPVYYGNIPEKESTSQYDYEFAGWDREIVPVTGDTQYTARYNETLRKYYVIWNNYDGTELYTENVAYGETPVYGGETPEKPSENGYDYVFIGWTPEISSVERSITYKAVFEERLIYIDPPLPDDPKDTYLLGDLNKDGTVDSVDALLMMRFSIGLADVDDADIVLGDVDKNTVIDTNDAILTLRYSVGLRDGNDIGTNITGG